MKKKCFKRAPNKKGTAYVYKMHAKIAKRVRKKRKEEKRETTSYNS